MVGGSIGVSTVANSTLSGQVLVSDGTSSNWKRLDRPASASAQVLKYNGGNVYWDPASAVSTSFASGRLYNNDDDYSSHAATTSMALFSEWANADTPINMTVDQSTGKFTIQAAGYYKCTFFMACNSTNADPFVGLYINGGAVGLPITSQSTGYNYTASFPPVYCAVGDYVQVYISRTSSGSSSEA